MYFINKIDNCPYSHRKLIMSNNSKCLTYNPPIFVDLLSYFLFLFRLRTWLHYKWRTVVVTFFPCPPIRIENKFGFCTRIGSTWSLETFTPFGLELSCVSLALNKYEQLLIYFHTPKLCSLLSSLPYLTRLVYKQESDIMRNSLFQ